MFFYLHLVCETHCAAGRTLGQNIVKSRSSTVSPNIVKPQGKRCKIPLPFFCFAFLFFVLVDTKKIIFMFCCFSKMSKNHCEISKLTLKSTPNIKGWKGSILDLIFYLCKVFLNKKIDRFNGYQAFNKQKTTFFYIIGFSK